VKAEFLYSSSFRKNVAARIDSERYDLVILNGSDLAWVLKDLPPSIPRVLVAHNIEHLLFHSQIQTFSRLYRPLSGLFRSDCERLKRYELNAIREIGNVIFLSHDDAAYARNLCSGLVSTTIPPVFDYEPRPRQRLKAGATLEIGLLGYFKWWPNQLSLHWFVNEVLPHVKAPIRLHLFGQPGGRNWRSDPRIVEHGMVEQIEEVWANCSFLICPTFATGGVCVKLAEAVYNRMPVLATRHALRGLTVDEDPALVLLDEPREWIEFLNSPAAGSLAERQVSEKTAARFAMDPQKENFQQFIRGALARGGLKFSHTI
jgi:hypothetical protein